AAAGSRPARILPAGPGLQGPELRQRRRARRASRPEFFERLEERLVLGRGLLRLLPHAPRLVALAELPEHLAEVRADLGVRTPAVGATQRRRRALEIAFAVL